MTQEEHVNNEFQNKDESLFKNDLFHKLISKMEQEVIEMPNVAARRGFYKIWRQD
ncbi:MAG: hypothetical protein LBE12_20990 [Planctomycetaceae bacterium]|jgi:hypothetical protein|nr:hypothetical protein [Planctomycetaceae bacterium]